MLDAVLDAALDAVITSDADGRVLQFNRAAEELFGYRREDVLGEDVAELVVPRFARGRHPRGPARGVAGWPGATLGRRVEMTALRADGSEIPVELTVTRSGTEPTRLTAWIRDLSGLKRASDQAARRARILRDAERIAGCGSWEWNVETGELSFSENLYRLLELDPDTEPSFELIAQLRHPDDDKRVRAVLERVRTTGAGSLEHRVRRRDGSIGHVRQIASALEWKDGCPLRIVGTFQDVTDQRLAEQEILAHHAVAGVLAEWPGFEEGLVALLRGLATAMGWIAGAIWLVDGDVLSCHTFWRRDGRHDLDGFEAASRDLRFPRGSGLPGQAWEQERPINLANVLEDPSFRRRDAAKESGLRGALAFPAIEQGEVLAVFELYALENRALPDRLMQTLTGMSQEIGYFLSQRRGELTPTNLTPREIEVLQHAARGGSGPKIAEELFVSPSTVKTHFEHIYIKLGVRDRPAAVAKALRLGLIH